MELSIALFVLLVVAALIVGCGLGLFLAKRRARFDQASGQDDAPQTAVLKAELDEAVRGSRREVQQRHALRSELDDVEASLAATARRLVEREEALRVAEDRVAIAEREATALRSHFGDIVGLESENTTLRAIAARVPELEARIAALDTEPPVIDLREGVARRSG